MRTSAVGAAVAAWAATDLPAARRWSLDQQPGEDRDRILGLLVMGAAAGGEFDRDLLAGFDSDSLRDQAAGAAIALIARSDPAQARDLLEREIDNPAERARIEAQIAQNASSAD